MSNISTVAVLDEDKKVIREQLGFSGLHIGDNIQILDNNKIDPSIVWLVESEPFLRMKSCQ